MTKLLKFTINIKMPIMAILILVCITSCASRKDLVYFQDQPLSGSNKIDINTDLVYNANDLLVINVSALEPEAARPFNLQAVAYNAEVVEAQGTLKMQTYLIDSRGEIEYPVLGTLKIGGLTRTQATDYLKERLSEYIKNPIVNIRLANFRITVIGEVNRPGTFTIQDERISIIEALGLAGDLTIYGRRDNIFLIRDINGEKRFSKLDLTSINIVNSPVYYLAQNDIIAVEPNKSKVRSSTFNPNTAVLISAISTLATIAAILIR